MTEGQKLTVTDIERKAITFCKEKEITFPVANYLVEFTEEVTKDLQEKNKHLEELLSVQYPDLKQSLDWANERENENVEIIHKAKELIKNIIKVTWGEGWSYSLDWKVKAEEFLREN